MIQSSCKAWVRTYDDWRESSVGTGEIYRRIMLHRHLLSPPVCFHQSLGVPLLLMFEVGTGLHAPTSSPCCEYVPKDSPVPKNERKKKPKKGQVSSSADRKRREESLLVESLTRIVDLVES